jgi:uncharacterized damage-inducible protein DinB
MDVSGYMVELYGRLPDLVRHAVEGLDDEDLVTPPQPGANTIAWLVWHLTRVQDHHVAALVDEPQRYLIDAWYERFGRDPDPEDHGYGHQESDVLSVRGTASDLIAYHDAVHERTIDLLRGLQPADLDEVVDQSWDPPVTMGVRLACLASDCLQHAGQAAYARGLLAS